MADLRSKYEQQIVTSAKRWNVDPNIVRAIHFVEDTSEDPAAKSSAGAVGEMQFMPETWKQYAAKGAKITDPAANIDAGAHYLSYLSSLFGGNLDKVFTAYNAGEGNVERGMATNNYARNAEAVLKRMVADVGGPGHADLAKGGKPAPKPLAAAPKIATAGFGEQAGMAVEHLLAHVEPAVSNAISHLWNPSPAALAAYGASHPGEAQHVEEQREAIRQFVATPVGQTAKRGAYLAGEILTGAVFGSADALLQTGAMVPEGGATTGPSVPGDIWQHIVTAFHDPAHAGDVIDQMAEQYTPFRGGNTDWWAQPGVLKMIQSGKPMTPEGMAMKQMLLLRADAGRFLVNKPYLAGAGGFVQGWFTPTAWAFGLVRSVVGGTIGLAGKGLDVAHAAGEARAARGAGGYEAPETFSRDMRVPDVIKPAPLAVKPSERVANAYEKTLGPNAGFPWITGDRFRPVHKAQGEVGEQAQRDYVRKQSESRYWAQTVLNQPHVLGGTTPSTQALVHFEQDRFYNARTTLHTNQPEGGDPYHDELTNTTMMKLGPAFDPQIPHDPTAVRDGRVVYADHPSPVMPGELPSTPEIASWAKVGEAMLGPEKGVAYNKLLNSGDVRGALGMLEQAQNGILSPAIQAHDIDNFVTGLQSQIATAEMKLGRKMTAPELRRLIQEAAGRKALGHWMTATGRDAAQVKTPFGTQVVLPRKITAMQPDTTQIGGFSAHDRAYYFAHAMNAAKDRNILLAPSTARYQINGYAPRDGMWLQQKDAQGNPIASEESELEHGARVMTAGSGGGGALLKGPQREFGSLRHAMGTQPGVTPGVGFIPQVPDPKFSLALAAEDSLTKSTRFQEYVQYAQQSAAKVTRTNPLTSSPSVVGGLIDYDTALRAAIKGQGSRLADAIQHMPEEPLGRGPRGRQDLDKWVADFAAHRRLPGGANAWTKAQLDVPDPNKSALVTQALDKEKSAIYSTIEDQFKNDNPDLTWQADKTLGVPDLAGLAVPKVNAAAAIDGHPVLERQAGMQSTPAWALHDTADNHILNALETLSNTFRTIYMVNPLYHPFKNVATLSFFAGHLNAAEITQGLFAPLSISDDLMNEAREQNALRHKFTVGPAGRQERSLVTYATPDTYAKTPKGIVAERGDPRNLRRRVSTALEGFQNVQTGAQQMGISGAGSHVAGAGIGGTVGGLAGAFVGGPVGAAAGAAAGAAIGGKVGMHYLAKAMYNADKGNTEWTFGVGEDALRALNYRKLRDINLSKGMKPAEARAKASNDTNKILDDAGNSTTAERAAGMWRMGWWYSWTRAQARLWSTMKDPRLMKGVNAVNSGIQDWNENTSFPDQQKQTDAGKIAFATQGDHEWAIQVAPPPMNMAQGITDLVTAPLTAGQGLVDFGKFVESKAASGIFSPLAHTFMAAWQTLGSQPDDPAYGKTLTDTDLPGSDQAARLPNTLATNLSPYEAQAAKRAVQTNTFIPLLMSILGYPVTDVDAQQEMSRVTKKEYNVRDRLHRALKKNPTDADRDEAKQDVAPTLEGLEDLSASLRSGF